MNRPDHPEFSKLRELFPTGYCGVAKNGWPVYIERNGKIQVDGIYELADNEEILQMLAKSYEILTRRIYMACSHAQGKQIQNNLSILDLDGFGMSMINSKTNALLKSVMGVMQDNYPENLGKSYIVNSPFVFTGVWKIVKNFLDEKTV